MRPRTLGLGLVLAASTVLIGARRSAPTIEAPVPWELCPDVEVAPPDAGVLEWRACGDGCRELALDGPRRLFGVLGGTAGDGTHWLGMVRDQGEAHELDLYRLPAAEPVFAARMTKGFAGCLVRLRAIGEQGALVEASFREADGTRRRLVSAQPSGTLVADDRAPRPPLETAYADGMRAQTTTRRSIEVDDQTVWSAPRDVLVSDLVAGRGAVAFTAVKYRRASLELWTRDGTRTLAADAGGPATDGRDLVWFALEAGTPALFTAPFPAGAPRRLRAAHQDYVEAGRGVVGDGYALHVERRHAEPEGTLILTRLATGATWVIPPRPNARWGTPLWVDRDELAIVLDADAATVRAGALGYGESLTIVRLAHPDQ